MSINGNHGMPFTQSAVRHPDPEAQVMELRATARGYDRCPFKVGDLVTPLPNGPIMGENGQPCIVVEVADPPHRCFTPTAPGETTAQSFGQKLDVRVLCFGHQAQISAWWAESWMFVPYTGPGADDKGGSDPGGEPVAKRLVPRYDRSQAGAPTMEEIGDPKD